ncbi:c-type cytochrome [Bauldia sp.]|uniref:c-type cytochrome n=1 Tax=Bauldia sp. TaxID=2575872 RepID=UPI003BA98E9C
MVRRLVAVLIVIVVIAAVAGWLLTAPRGLAASDLPDHTPDLANGEYMFWAGGCESCHAPPDASADDLFNLAGGLDMVTPFGTFYAPNISPDEENGIGSWSTLDFVNAMKFGVGKGGEHLYPAFPYTSYQRMTLEDIIDLKAFLDTLEPVNNVVPAHDLGFPFNIRRGLGLWQLLYVDGETFVPDPDESDEINRGAYLVGGPAHCGECHSPRNAIGGIIADRAYSGGPAPEGDGTVPNITPDPSGIGSWSAADIVTMFQTGFTPEFDSVGGTMAAVQRNMARLSDEDLAAMAAYLKSLPPIPSEDAPAS